jgi:hypothetical protein
MPTSPRYHVVTVSMLGGRYEADGWLEIRTREPGRRWWEARCKVLRWDHQEITGSVSISVHLGLASGGELTGRAYVDQAHHLWGWNWDEADLQFHGTEDGLKLRE